MCADRCVCFVHSSTPSLPTTSQTDTCVVNFADEGVETAYRREVAELVAWCQKNNLSLYINKTKEMIIDPRWGRRDQPTPLHIGETEVDRVKTMSSPGLTTPTPAETGLLKEAEEIWNVPVNQSPQRLCSQKHHHQYQCGMAAARPRTGMLSRM